MKSILFTTAAILMLLIPTSCHRASTQRFEYLNTAVGNSSQDQVASALGPPGGSRPLSDGGQIWVYRYRGYHPYAGVSCTEYVLTFDAEKVLRNWTTEHGCQEPIYPQ